MPAPAKTLQEQFDGFIAALWQDERKRPYPAGPAYEALRKAFFGGCLVAYKQDYRMDLAAWRAQLLLLRNVAAETEYVQ